MGAAGEFRLKTRMGQAFEGGCIGCGAPRLRGSGGPGPFTHAFQEKSLWNQELKAVRNARDFPVCNELYVGLLAEREACTFSCATQNGA